MFKIGDFSRFTRVSVKMLRHYDHLGLLKPARIDPATNYRYYSADQLPRLNRLLALRELGLTLEQVGTLLDGGADGAALPVEQIRGMLRLKQAELAQQVQEQQRRLDAIQARLDQIEREGQADSADVVVRRVAPQLMARLRTVVADDDDTHLVFEEAERHVAQYGARASAPPLAIFHDGEYREDTSTSRWASRSRPPSPARPASRWASCRARTAWPAWCTPAATPPLARPASGCWAGSRPTATRSPGRRARSTCASTPMAWRPAAAQRFLRRSAEEFVTELQLPVVKMTKVSGRPVTGA